MVGELPVVLPSPCEIVLTTLVESLSVNDDEELEELDEEFELSDLEPVPLLEEVSSLFDPLLELRLPWEFPEELPDETLPMSLEESFSDGFVFSDP